MTDERVHELLAEWFGATDSRKAEIRKAMDEAGISISPLQNGVSWYRRSAAGIH